MSHIILCKTEDSNIFLYMMHYYLRTAVEVSIFRNKAPTRTCMHSNLQILPFTLPGP
jgi:hypothetical protein